MSPTPDLNVTHQDVLAIAVDAARRTTLVLHGLMAANAIPSFEELQLLLAWPAGMETAYREWLASMAGVVNALAHAEGVEHTAHLSDKDKIRLTHKAYDLVMS